MIRKQISQANKKNGCENSPPRSREFLATLINQTIISKICHMHKITLCLFLVFLLSVFDVSSQSEEILLARVNIGGEYGYYGYIDKTGKMAIKPQFDDAADFQEGLAAIKVESKYGYIDRSGEIVIKQQFDYAGDFQEGLARIELGGKWGFIDKTGKIAIELQFDEVWFFQKGLARIQLGSKYGYVD